MRGLLIANVIFGMQFWYIDYIRPHPPPFGHFFIGLKKAGGCLLKEKAFSRRKKALKKYL
jgi:hypothetical protein